MAIQLSKIGEEGSSEALGPQQRGDEIDGETQRDDAAENEVEHG
jgi:hypothetical protein